MSVDKTASDTRLAGDPVRIIADSPLLRSVDRSSLSDLASELEWVVLSDEVQSTSAVAMRDSVLLEFSHDNFRELATLYPGLNLWLARLMSKRLQGVIRQTPAEQMSTNILFIPANDGAPLEVFVRQFSELLSREATCLFISSVQTDTFLGADGIAQTAQGSPEELRLRAWLDQQETRFRYVIYLADADVTNWTRRCIRQAAVFRASSPLSLITATCSLTAA